MRHSPESAQLRTEKEKEKERKEGKWRRHQMQEWENRQERSGPGTLLRISLLSRCPFAIFILFFYNFSLFE